MTFSEQTRTRAAVVCLALLAPLLFFHHAVFSEDPGTSSGSTTR
jgi:hypothetical protein